MGSGFRRVRAAGISREKSEVVIPLTSVLQLVVTHVKALIRWRTTFLPKGLPE